METIIMKNEGQFQRKMTSRHLFMLSLGGVIGTGLFLSSGYTIAQAGPLGAILSLSCGSCCSFTWLCFRWGVSGSYASNGILSHLCH